MAVQSYSIEFKSINLIKFGSLKGGVPAEPDKINSLNIFPQVNEVTIFESIFNPVIKVEIAVLDYIGLFINWPLTGNEIIEMEYKNVADNTTRKLTLAIESITDPTPDNKSRGIGFIINCMSIEGLANMWSTVQQAYEGTSLEIVRQIFKDHITDRIKKFYPAYGGENQFGEPNETVTSTIVIPNMYPFSAINMVQSLAVSEVSNRNSYFFFQNANGFNFRTIQGMTQGTNALRHAKNNGYKYFSDEISEVRSKMNNEERVVSSLTFNRRHSALQRTALGYFNNNLFEVNIAQKAIHNTRTKTEDVLRMFPHGFDTKEYIEYNDSVIEGDENANRTAYVITTRPEEDKDFPVLRTRDRWGKDIISKIALAQVDLTVVIPGTNQFTAGDLFYLDIPKFDGFNPDTGDQEDDLITGYFLITEVKHVILIGGFQSTTLRLNKDSYNTTVDRPSRYVK